MSDTFADRLIEAIEKKAAPICVGIDPIFEMLPDGVAGDARTRNANDAEEAIDAIFEFTIGVSAHRRAARAVREISVGVLREVSLGRRRSLLQPDRGSRRVGAAGDRRREARRHRQHRRQRMPPAHLADQAFDEAEDVVVPDAITVNPFCGLDTIEPFVNTAMDSNKGLFVLVRTSNPGSGDVAGCEAGRRPDLVGDACR